MDEIINEVARIACEQISAHNDLRTVHDHVLIGGDWTPAARDLFGVEEAFRCLWPAVWADVRTLQGGQ